MAKKIKAPKAPKEKEIDNFCEEVVLMDDVCQVIMKNVFESLDILRSLTFCSRCREKISQE
jgi:hypothetical protein